MAPCREFRQAPRDRVANLRVLTDMTGDVTVSDDEQLVAEQIVATERDHALAVRISQHPAEDFYRVDVTSLAAPDLSTTTTVSPGDSFMMNLIEGAVSGEQVAWRHLAHWGQDNLSFAGTAPRRCFS